MKRALVALLSTFTVLSGRHAAADEGMWLVNHFPSALVKQRHGAEVTPAWLDALRLASVRIGSGGSGAFVSPRGLVLTNHHVGADCIAKLGRKDRDLLAEGFSAPRLAEEIRCPDLELDVLVGIDDVTAEIRAVERPGMDHAAVLRAQKEKMATLEKTCVEQTKLRCEMVTLYSGGMFHLYRYRRHTDVRLVFAPEQAIAYFGGDHDNFTFPRYDLDVAFFRVHEGDRPLRPERWLKLREAGPREGELVFTSGHPATTERLSTVAQLLLLRDVAYPTRLRHLRELRRALVAFAARDKEAERQATDAILSYENGIKAISGYLAGLADQALLRQKIADEEGLRRRFTAEERHREGGEPWTEIARSQKAYAGFWARHLLLERAPIDGDLFRHARTLVRLAEERAKPSQKRLREYRDSNLPSVELKLFSTAPVHDGVEEALLAAGLRVLRFELGADAPVVRTALAGKEPEARARELVSGTTLRDVDARRRLAASARAVAASRDPLIELARALDAEARAVRARFEDEVESVVKRNLALLARWQFEERGTAQYPDATFTLRVSFGRVLGYPRGGREIPAATTLGGLFRRAEEAGGRPPFALPASWIAARPRLRQETPMNFVSTNDTTGGNSGSPVLSANGEVVGVIFDSNLEGLPNRFLYREEQGRAISVHAAAIVESLRTVYGAGWLVDELLAK